MALVEVVWFPRFLVVRALVAVSDLERLQAGIRAPSTSLEAKASSSFCVARRIIKVGDSEETGCVPDNVTFLSTSCKKVLKRHKLHCFRL